MKVIGICGLNKMIDGKANVRMPYTYVESVLKAGGVPLVLPVILDDDVIDKMLNLIDGLIIPGGDDIHPRFFNQKLLPFSNGIDESLDLFQFKLIEKALKRNLPILGICRGIQVLNVYFGGDIYQDLALIDNKELLVHDQLKHGFSFYDKVHDVSFIKGSMLHYLYGEKIQTNSFHHQVIKDLGKGLKAIGKTEDGIVEAIVHPHFRFVLGVQWHPERSKDQIPLFKFFIKHCK